MNSILLFLILFGYCNAENKTLCTGLRPNKIVLPSAVGKWYLVRSSKIGNITENKNTCGFFNTMRPCKCIGVNIESTMPPPSVKKYTLQNFGYNEKYNAYAFTKILLNLISRNSSIFNAYVPLAKVNFTIAILQTDDYLSWMTLAMCDILQDGQGNQIQLKWIITRSPMPTKETINIATKAIKQNSNLKTNDLIMVNQSGCRAGF